MGWAPRERPWTLTAGLLHLDAKPGEATEFFFNRKNDAPFLAAFASGPFFRIAFEYRSTAVASLILHGNTMEKPKGDGGRGTPPRSETALPPSAEWREFSWDAPAPQQECQSLRLKLACRPGGGFVEMRNLSIVDVAPEDTSGRPLLVNGARAEEVCLYASDAPRRRESDLRAALMFRFALRAAGGEWLPIREVGDAGEAGANAVLVGRLAVDAGVVAAADQAKVDGLTGGWATAASGSRLGLAGAAPCGVQRGAWRVLERLGIVYLGSDMFKPFADEAFETGDFADAAVPAMAFPLAAPIGRSGLHAELRGLSQRECVLGALSLGAVPERDEIWEDSLGFIVPVSEFRDSHPEYFALQADGTRLTDDAHTMNFTHFCWTAPGLPELVAARYCEMMRAHPEQPVWILAPGDGGGLNCKCDGCRALGSDSDGLVRLANRVAELTSREFPENLILIYSYIDTPEPPTRPVRAHGNVNVGYCAILSKFWPSCMVIPHPANARGERAAEAWRRECCPNLSLLGYFMQPREWMNCWPGFDADVRLTRDFAEHRALLSLTFGLYPTHGNSTLQGGGCFIDLTIHVLSRLSVNPGLDAYALAHEFIDSFYGAAAGPMHDFFEQAVAEPRRRDWIQNAERHLKGFVTKEFADRAFPLLDEAERLADGDEALARRIRKEVIPFYWTYLNGVGRGNGNISAAELGVWSRRVARFAKACRDNGTYHMGRGAPAKKWFHDNILLDLTLPDGAADWTVAPEIDRLIEDPVKTLSGDFPNFQSGTARGWEIPAEGMKGGEFQKNCHWRRKEGGDVRIVRRESSGFGIVFTRLDLGETPAGPAKLVVSGIDSEKEAVAEIEVKVNAEVVYAGPVRWGKTRHSEWEIDLPAGLLKAGANEIQFRNTTPDAEAALDGEGGDDFRAIRNYFWGWFMMDKVEAVLFSGDMTK